MPLARGGSRDSLAGPARGGNELPTCRLGPEAKCETEVRAVYSHEPCLAFGGASSVEALRAGLSLILPLLVGSDRAPKGVESWSTFRSLPSSEALLEEVAVLVQATVVSHARVCKVETSSIFVLKNHDAFPS